MSLYDDLGGFDGLLALSRHWHALCLADPVACHPFQHAEHPQHDERFAAYLAEVTGGPMLYSAGYGDESAMQRQHAGNGEHVELDERCQELFVQALADLGAPAEAAARLGDYFWTATVAQRAYGDGAHLVPEGLPLNRVPGA